MTYRLHEQAVERQAVNEKTHNPDKTNWGLGLVAPVRNEHKKGVEVHRDSETVYEPEAADGDEPTDSEKNTLRRGMKEEWKLLYPNLL